MKIGMIGLGKMGANMTERLLKGGHEVVAYDLSADAVQGGGGQGRGGGDEPGRPGREAGLPPGGLGDAARRAHHGLDRRGAVRHVREGRRHHRRWELQLQGVEGARRQAREHRGRLRRRRDVGRRVGPDRGLLPHGRRHQRGGGGRRAGAPDPGARGRLRPRGPGRRGALREDGAQRRRVRAHAGLRRGLRDHGQGRRVRPRPARDRLHLALRLGGAQLAARPGRAGAAARGGLRRHQGRGGRLGRRPLDGAGGHRPWRPGTGHRHLALHPLRLPGAGLAPAEDALRAAQPVRWPRRHARVGRAGPGDRDPDARSVARHAHPRRRRPPRLQRRRARGLRGAPGPALRAGALGRPDGAGVLRGAGHRRRHRLGRGRHLRRGRARRAARRRRRQPAPDHGGPHRPGGRGRVLLAHADRRPGRTSAWPPTSAPCRTW